MATAATRDASPTQPVQQQDSSRHVASQAVSDELPDQATMDDCAPLPIYDVEGKSHRFDSLYTGSKRRDLVIFVRHFFCGMCQDFLQALNAAISPSELAALSTPTTLSVIGCGDSSLLKDYVRTTNNAFPIYADPSRQLYDRLGMTSTLSAGEKPDYQSSSVFGVAKKSFVQIIGAGSGIFKGGNFSQVGGEFLFEDGRAAWCHRMRNTRDHTDIPQVKKLLTL